MIVRRKDVYKRQHLYCALAGLDFADPLLHDFALRGRLAFERVQFHEQMCIRDRF